MLNKNNDLDLLKRGKVIQQNILKKIVLLKGSPHLKFEYIHDTENNNINDYEVFMN